MSIHYFIANSHKTTKIDFYDKNSWKILQFKNLLYDDIKTVLSGSYIFSCCFLYEKNELPKLGM